MAGVLVRDPHRQLVSLRPRLELGEQLVDVDHANGEIGVLQVRPATRRVDDDRVDVAEDLGDPRGAAAALLEPAGVEMQRAAALLAARRDDLAALGGEHARGRGVHVPEDDPLDAAEQEPDAHPLHTVGREDLRRLLGRPPRRLQRRKRREPAGQPPRRQRQRHPQPPRMRHRREDERSLEPLPARPVDSSARCARASPRSAGRTARPTGTTSRTPCSRGSGRSAARSCR